LPNAEAYTLYLHGLELRDQQHLDQLVEAAREFEQALALDPSFLRAAEALALTDVALGFDEDLVAHDAWQHARENAKAALRIDPNSAPAHGVLGLVHAEDEYDWSAAEAEFRKALALNPRDPVTLDYAAIIASARGQFEAGKQLSNASLALDPLNPYAQQKLGQMHLAMGDFAGAEVAIRKSITINATFDGNHYFLGRMLLARGQIEAARKEMQAELASDAKDAGLAMVYHALGRKAESDAALARLVQASSDTWPYSVATVHAYRGERDEAIEWLEKACAARDSDLLEGIRGDPEFAPLRHDPRYKELLRKMNLPEA
jgi:serine/threonine-protein kinase